MSLRQQIACNFDDCFNSREFLASLAISLFALTAIAAEPGSLSVPANAGGEEIQRVLDGLPAGGEAVLAPGTYIVRQPIILRYDHQTLRGSGSSTVLYLADNANCPVVILGPTVKAPEHPTAHVHLADLLIDGNRQHQQLESWQSTTGSDQIRNNGVTVRAAVDALVERVVCCRCRSGGLVSSEGTRRPTVRDFIAFDNQFDGLACYQTEESIFTGLLLHDNLSAGISLDLDFGHNVISDAVLTGNDLGIFMRDARNNLFQALIIRQSRKHGVFMAQSDTYGQDGWQLRPNTECTGNSFVGLVISDCGGKAFLVNDGSCTNNLISGARFLNNVQGGLTQDGTGSVTVQGLLEN